MRVTAESYFHAAQDHVEDASILWGRGRFVLAHYVAGLAVECMFRAYAVRHLTAFDARHDLRQWFEAARFDEVVAKKRLVSIEAAYSTVATQWNSTQRYYSIEILRAYFRDAQINRGIKGDAVKELSRRIVEAALEIVTEGVLRWKN